MTGAFSHEMSADDAFLQAVIRTRAAKEGVAQCTSAARTNALEAMACALKRHESEILAANIEDVVAAKNKNLSTAMIDRLRLDPARFQAICDGVRAIAAQPDPVGRVLASWQRPNGLKIERIAVPLGVIGIIYESRPNVTADALALCVRSGNACILRGGSDSLNSSEAIFTAMQDGLHESGLPQDAYYFVRSADRDLVGKMLGARGLIDVIVPRGGKSLVARVQQESRVPIFAHLEGNNHVYVHASADKDMAEKILLNAKMRRTSVCGAAETVLIDRAFPAAQQLIRALLDAGCAVRGDADVQLLDPRVVPASESDWQTEYLDAIIAAKFVHNIDDAIEHIRRYGSGHTEAIVSQDGAMSEAFLTQVDSALVLVNASTQFADGGEFGFGGELGIATGRLHARGPVGAEQLTTFKYCLRGNGQIRA